MRVGYWHMVSLTAAGNAFLKGVLDNDTCVPRPDDVNSVIFYNDKRFTPTVVANSEKEWFDYLMGSGCKGIKMRVKDTEKYTYIPAELIDDIRHGFMSAIYSDCMEIWVSNFKAIRKSPAKTRWVIQYACSMIRHKECGPDGTNLDFLELRLGTILHRIGDFSIDIGMGRWKKFFDEGIEVLEAGSDISSSSILIPEIYPPLAKKLLIACERSWVFGGMGSWIDEPKGYAERSGRVDEYCKLTNELSVTMRECIEGAVNSASVRCN